jgi:murein DD-endopeptidase MepM/ murein hydrolase activator NlpD
MIRRVVFGTAVCLLLLMTSAAAGSNGDKLSSLQQKVERATKREGVLTTSIAAMNRRIHSLRKSVAAAESKLPRLQASVAVHEERLGKVQAVYDQQTQILEAAQRTYAVAEHRLAQRLIDVYETGRPDTIAVVLGSESISDAMEQLEYIENLSAHDRALAAQATEIKDRWTKARARTQRLLRRVAAETRAVEVEASRVIETRNRLSDTRQRLQTERGKQKRTLAGVRESREKWLGEIAALEAGSADIAARLRSSGSHSNATPSSAGLIWPVHGVLTSPFGMRWGRMHEGIDIGAPTGTPIWAAAGGTVVYAGWEGGYGNLTVIDHGNGLATAYGHQSKIVVSNGQTVARGQVIGYVGSTGHSTGPHLHFEVRVNGTPVDPLGYLP